jgi:hypothetical protein
VASKEVLGKTVAYLRQEKETFEIDYPVDKVWATIPQAVKTLEWKIEQTDDETHHAKIKTKSAFLSYGSTLLVDAVAVDEKKCRVTAQAETPVTTITAMADFGRSRDRIEMFFEALARQMLPPGTKNKPAKPKKKDSSKTKGTD